MEYAMVGGRQIVFGEVAGVTSPSEFRDTMRTIFYDLRTASPANALKILKMGVDTLARARTMADHCPASQSLIRRAFTVLARANPAISAEDAHDYQIHLHREEHIAEMTARRAKGFRPGQEYADAFVPRS